MASKLINSRPTLQVIVSPGISGEQHGAAVQRIDPQGVVRSSCISAAVTALYTVMKCAGSLTREFSTKDLSVWTCYLFLSTWLGGSYLAYHTIAINSDLEIITHAVLILLLFPAVKMGVGNC